MLSFIFQHNSAESEDHRCTADLYNTDILETYRTRRGVAAITEGWLSIPESALPETESDFVLHMAFCISEDAGETMILAEGSGYPLLLRLSRRLRGGRAYQLSAGVRVSGKLREVDCILPLECQRWYELEMVLLKGGFTVCIDGKPVGRRVYRGGPSFTGSGEFFIGNGRRTEGMDFTGYLDNLSFSARTDEEQQRLEQSLAAQGWMEIESKARDLNLMGMRLSEPLVTEEPLPLHTSGRAYYNMYKTGVIVWSSTHGCVWFSRSLFAKFSSLLNTSDIGLPCTDELRLCMDWTLVRFDDGGILHHLPQDELFYLPGLWLDSYLDWTTPEHDPPMEEPVFFWQGSVSGRSMKCRNSILLEHPAEDQTRITPLPYSWASAYLKDCGRYGTFMDRYGSCRTDDEVQPDGSVLSTHTAWLRCTNCTLCFYEQTRQPYANCPDSEVQFLDNQKMILMHNDLFDYTQSQTDGLYGHPIEPHVTLSDGTVYQNFSKGVLVRHPDGIVRGYHKLLLTLLSIRSEAICDGGNDRSAELYLTVSIQRNGQPLCTNQRWPDPAERKHGGSAFSIVYGGNSVDAAHPAGLHVRYDFGQLRGDDEISVQIRTYDYDTYSSNDYLSSHRFTLNAANGWGLYSDCMLSPQLHPAHRECDATAALYEDANQDHRGADLGRHDMWLTFRLESPE